MFVDRFNFTQYLFQCLAVFLIRSPPETDLVSMLPLVTDGSEDPELEEEEEEVYDHLRQHGVVNPEEEASLLAQGNSIVKLICEQCH